MSREPIFGPNAKPMLVQTIIGIVVAMVIAYFVIPIIDPPLNRFTCTYITGSCLPGREGAASARQPPAARSP